MAIVVEGQELNRSWLLLNETSKKLAFCDII